MITREWILIIIAGLLTIAIVTMGLSFIDIFDVISYSPERLQGLLLGLALRFLFLLLVLWVTISHLVLLRRYKALNAKLAS